MKFSLLLLVLVLGTAIAELPEGFEDVSLEDFYTDITLQNLVDFGGQHVIRAGIELGNLPDTEYFITQIYSIAKKTKEEDAINYAFDVMIMDQDGSAIRSNYIVTYTPSTKAQKVLAYTYDEEFYNLDIEVESSDSQDQLPLELFVGDQMPEVDRSTEWLGDIWFTEDELVDEEGVIITGAPTSVGIDKFNNDPEIQNLFLFGLEEVLQQVLPEDIAVSQVHVKNVFDVQKKVVNGISYTFDAEVEDSEGVTVRTKFEVYSQSWTGVLEVLSFSYTLTGRDGSVFSGEENFMDY